MSSQTIITLTGDEKSAYEAFQKVIAEAAKLGNETEKAGKKAKKTKDEFNFGKQASDGFHDMATSVLSVTAAVGVLQLGLEGVRAEYERINEVGREQLGFARNLATAQQEASKNLAGTDPAEMQRLFGEAVPRIAVESKFPDLAQITTAIGAAASIIGSDRAETVVSAAAQLTALTPDQLQTTTSATADVTKAIGVNDAREALALLLSTGSVSRPENLPQLATGAAKAINAGVVSTADTQSQINAAKESAALFAMLSEVDPSGQSASTATVQLISQMRDMFSAMGAEERDKKASELANKRERAEEDLLRTQIQLEQRQKKATALGTADTVEARAARLSVSTTQAEAKRLTQSISDMDKELAQFASIATMRASDPGTTVGRIQAVAQNADARNFLLQNLAGEAVFKPLFEGLLTSGSEQQRKLAAAQGAITTDISVFEKALQSQDITPQQQIARDMQLSQALQNVDSVADPQLEFARAIKEIRINAEANNTLPRSMFLATGRLFENIFRPIMPDSLGSPQIEARYAIERLQEIISEAEPVGGFRRPEDLRQADMLREQIKVIQRLEEQSRTSDLSQLKTILGPAANPPAPVQPIQPPSERPRPLETATNPDRGPTDKPREPTLDLSREQLAQQLAEARRRMDQPPPANVDAAALRREQMQVIERLEQLSRDMQANTEEVRRNNNILQQDTQTNNSGTIQAQVDKRK